MIVERQYDARIRDEQREFARKLFQNRNSYQDVIVLIDDRGRGSSCTDVLEYHVGDITTLIASNPEYSTVILIGREETIEPAVALLGRITGIKLLQK